jgi:hypothetical protein
MMSLDRLLSDADPAAGKPAIDGDSPEAQAALEAIVTGRHLPVRRHRRGRTPAAIVAVAAAVIAASIFVVLPGGPTHPGPAAAATLLRLSDVASRQPALIPTRPGQYYYTSYEYPQAVTINGNGCAVTQCEPAIGAFSVRYLIVEQLWVRLDGLARIQVARRDPTLVASTRSGWIASGRPSVAHLLPRSFSEIVHPISRRDSMAQALLDVERLPVQPSALKAAVNAGPLGGPGFAAQNRFDALAFVLSSGGASPRLRAAAFKVLAATPGIEGLGMVRDPLGRRGDGFAVAAGQRYVCDQSSCPASEIIIDPATGELLDDASLSARGTPSWTSYLSIGIANSIQTAPQVRK